MTNPTPHGQVPEALIDLIDAYAETRHRCGGIYNARTEAARKAVIEALSGVQALSAAPAGFVPVTAFDRLHAHAESLAARLLAASPTPPAEQQAAPKAAPGEPDPADIIAGALQISRGHAIEMMREALEAAPQQEAQEPVWDGKLSDAMQNALDALYLECGPGITRDITHQVQKECEAIYTSYTTTKRMYQAARDRLELLEAAQPQPDPFAAPQPAPAPLSDDAKDAARYRWLRATTNFATNSQGERIDVRNQPEKWDAAIDAALAAQGGAA